MSNTIGYVVIEFNQVSGQPDLATDELHENADDAGAKAEEFTAENRALGRRETYAIGTVYIEED
jgi:hypothetical protein